MDYKERQRDPRWIAAKTLFATEVQPRWKWGSGHALDNIEFAVCSEALGPEDSGYSDRTAGLAARTVRQFVKPHAQQAMTEQCERVIRSAERAGRTE